MQRTNVRAPERAQDIPTIPSLVTQPGAPMANLLSGSHRLLAQARGRACVAVDFGTSHSGFAYAYGSDGKIEGFYEWKDQLMSYAKTFTAIAYDGTGVTSWGYTAVKAATDNSMATARVCVLKKFKLLLHDHLAHHDSDARGSMAGRDVQKVIADYLGCMRLFILEVLQKKYGPTLTNDDIVWCLTVPAIWSDSAKANMRRAAAAAGYIDANDHSSSRLSLILEPEAAALFCCENIGQRKVADKEVIMTVDAGGGTADLTVHRVVEDKAAGGRILQELTAGTGALCGSTFIDERFIVWLGNKIGRNVIDRLKSEKLSGYWEVLRNWETLKRQFAGASTFTHSDHVSFTIPGALYNLMPQDTRENLEDSQDGISEEVFLTLADMKGLFDPVIANINDLIEAQLLACPRGLRVDAMLVVGGFAASKYLVTRLKEKFEGRVGRVLTPTDPGAAVVQGAVLYGLNPSMISTRRARSTYGLRVALPRYLVQNVNSADVFTHRENNEEWVWMYHPIVQKGQAIGAEEYYSDWIEPLYSSMTNLSVELFVVDEVVESGIGLLSAGKSFSDVSDTKKLGAVVAKDLSAGRDRTVEVRLYFGLTEVTMVSQVVSTEEEDKVVLAV